MFKNLFSKVKVTKLNSNPHRKHLMNQLMIMTIKT